MWEKRCFFCREKEKRVATATEQRKSEGRSYLLLFHTRPLPLPYYFPRILIRKLISNLHSRTGDRENKSDYIFSRPADLRLRPWAKPSKGSGKERRLKVLLSIFLTAAVLARFSLLWHEINFFFPRQKRKTQPKIPDTFLGRREKLLSKRKKEGETWGVILDQLNPPGGKRKRGKLCLWDLSSFLLISRCCCDVAPNFSGRRNLHTHFLLPFSWMPCMFCFSPPSCHTGKRKYKGKGPTSSKQKCVSGKSTYVVDALFRDSLWTSDDDSSFPNLIIPGSQKKNPVLHATPVSQTNFSPTPKKRGFFFVSPHVILSHIQGLLSMHNQGPLIKRSSRREIVRLGLGTCAQKVFSTSFSEPKVPIAQKIYTRAHFFPLAPVQRTSSPLENGTATNIEMYKTVLENIFLSHKITGARLITAMSIWMTERGRKVFYWPWLFFSLQHIIIIIACGRIFLSRKKYLPSSLFRKIGGD